MRFSSKWVRSLAATALLIFVAALGHAQDATSGSISGTITDATGAAIMGATVVLTNTDRNQVQRTLTTNRSGFYTATALPLGAYSVKITDPGFKSVTVNKLILHVADALTVNRSMSAGDTTEVITVNADAARVNLEDASSSGLINNEQMNEMPLATRNYASLVNLMPGVAYGGSADANLVRGPSGISGASSTVAYSINGGRTTSNSWTLDGADNLDRGANLTVYNYPAPDAIAEFKVLRGQYSAAYGRNASGQIDVVTKSGTNSLHGSAYEFVRNDAFDANGYSNNFLNKPKSPYRYNDFGFSIGGPVYIPHIYNGRDKTFFFVSEEWLRQISYNSNVQGLVPQASERTGDFTNSGQKIGGVWTTGPVTVCTAYANNPITQTNSCTASGTHVTNLSPMAVAYMQDVYSRIPVPDEAYNIAHLSDPHSIFTNFRNTFDNLDTVVRIDQQFGQKLFIFYRYIHDTLPEHLEQGQFTISALPGTNTTDVKNPGTQQLGHATYVFSPTLLLNAGYSFSNGNIVSTPSGYLASAQSPHVVGNLPYPNTVGLIPNLSISGMSGLAGSLAYIDHGTNHQAFGDITKQLRNLTLIAGFSYNHYQKLENNTTGTNGAFSFGNATQYACPPLPAAQPAGCVPVNSNSGAAEAQGFANFLIGNANSGFSQLSRDPVTDIKMALYEGFLQANWKATPRLTVNLGVRYAYYGQPWDANYLLSNFDPSRYSAAAAPTVATNGLLCFTGACSQAGSNAGQPTTPNANANYVGINYLNGMIYNGPNAANNNQASPYGNKVGKAQNTDFAPRFGFAYDLFGDGRTALRGGYGWAFDDAPVSYYETTVFKNPPAVATYSLGQASFDAPTGGSLTALTTTPGRVQGVPLEYKTPYVQQYSLDIQQQIGAKSILDIGYFGDHGTHLSGALPLNEPMPGAWVGKVQPTNSGIACIDPDTNAPAFMSSTCSRPLNQIKPYLGYDAVDVLRTIFSSNYNSLQVKFTKHFSGKSYVDVNYTWSRALTNAQADYSGFAQNIYNINGDYGRAAVDRNNILTMDGVFELPWYREQKGFKGRLIGGWQVSTIYTIQSGLPLTVGASSNYSAGYNLPGNAASVFTGSTKTGYINDNAGLGLLGATSGGLRANQLGDPNSGHGVKIHNKGYNALWFYTGAFAAAPPSQTNVAPTAHRGTIQGPGFNSLQLGVFRNFRIYNRINFQFRAEAYNAINHTNVSSINTSINSSSTFGEVTGYREARIMQFGGKITF
ncbi:MAG: carboxypeptidase regulatory-like domain-containing protein [Acidobacteriaceae bacterium]